MQRDTRPEVLDLQPNPPSRRESYRERTPSIGGSASLPPTHLVPEPAYIASSAATQIVNSEYVSRGPNWLDNEAGDASTGLSVSPSALSLINAFLDQMLFSFLKGARSTSIVALKPAITDVLKPRLAKDAIQGADEELRGYLVGGEDEELSDFHNSQEFKGERNLQRIFRTTRLRCMVYTRLGDMEEEDEEMYLEDEQAQDQGEDRHRLSRDLGNVSPAAAIFLTSIVEFIGEQTLMIAAEAAFSRLGTKKPGSDESRAMVEEGDVEKLAFNTTLGRLWRSWRGRVRPSSMLSPRSSIRDMHGRKSSYSNSELVSRTNSVSEEDGLVGDKVSRPRLSVAEVLHEDQDPASIPLPQSRGLPDQPDFDTATSGGRESNKHRRVRSMIEYPGPREPPVLPESESPEAEIEETTARPHHQRSASLPIKTIPYISPISDAFETPLEGPDPFSEGDVAHADAETATPQSDDDSQVVPAPEKDESGVSTMYDGVIAGKKELPEIRQSPIRESVSASEYSSQHDDEGHDHDMTPQALDYKKFPSPDEKGIIGDHESRTSTVSSDYSFRAEDPAAPTGIFSPYRRKDADAKEDPVPSSRDDPSSAEPKESAASVSKNIAGLVAVQGDRLRTFDQSGKAVKRDIPVLYEDPSNQNVIYSPKAPTPDYIEKSTTQTANRGITPGIPPLTPLRELKDAAQDTSDEASSIAPSHDTSRGDEFAPPYVAGNDEGQRSETYAPGTFGQPQLATSATRFTDIRNQTPPINTGSERAAVQRVTPTSTTFQDPSSHYGRTSSSSNRDARSASSSSRINKLVKRESSDQARQPVASRSSPDTSERLPIRYSKTPRTGDKELDFESLIKSDETIQYTLTPQNMREMEDPESPRWSDEARPSIASRAEGDRSASRSSGAKSASPAQPPKGMNRLRANPTAVAPMADLSSAPRRVPSSARSQPQGPVPKSPAGRTSMPRDASMKDGSMRDFADFIRSTGPDSDPKNMYRPTPTDKFSRTVSGSSAPASQNSSKKITKQSPAAAATAAPRKSEGALPTRSSSKLRARDPTVSSGNTTSELADFFRSGPPGGGPDGGSTLTKSSGAQMANGVSNGRTIGSGSSLASTQDSFAPSKMTQSSTNSRTGLLDSTNRPGNAASAPRSNRNDEGGPIRKQRRVRDPWAIDSDDEDDGSIEPQPEEESLSDFLRNYTPPPDANNGRDVTISLTPSTSTPDQKNRKVIPSGIRERLTRNIAVVPDYRPLPPKESKRSSNKSSPPSNERRQTSNQYHQQQSSTSSSYRDRPSGGSPGSGALGGGSQATAPQLPPLNPQSTSPHLVSQNGSSRMMDTTVTYRPSGAGTGSSNMVRSTTGGIKSKPQARDETSTPRTGGGMSDLAEFLRDTEPPAPSGPVMAVSGGGGGGMEKERGGRLFGRKRKV